MAVGGGGMAYSGHILQIKIVSLNSLMTQSTLQLVRFMLYAVLLIFTEAEVHLLNSMEVLKGCY